MGATPSRCRGGESGATNQTILRAEPFIKSSNGLVRPAAFRARSCRRRCPSAPRTSIAGRPISRSPCNAGASGASTPTRTARPSPTSRRRHARDRDQRRRSRAGLGAQSLRPGRRAVHGTEGHRCATTSAPAATPTCRLRVAARPCARCRGRRQLDRARRVRRLAPLHARAVTPSSIAASTHAERALLAMPLVVTVSGSPSAPSRTAQLTPGSALRSRRRVRGPAHQRARPAARRSAARARWTRRRCATRWALIERAQGVVVATPVYKAAYTGVLKSFLDLLPQFGLAGKVVCRWRPAARSRTCWPSTTRCGRCCCRWARSTESGGEGGGLTVDPEAAGRLDGVVTDFIGSLERQSIARAA